MTAESRTPRRHRAQLIALAEQLEEQLEELRTTVDDAGLAAGARLGTGHATEGNALTALIDSANRVVAALRPASTQEQAERMVEATIRAEHAGLAMRARLAELESLPELASNEAQRRAVATSFGDPLVTTTHVELRLPSEHATSRCTISIGDDGTIMLISEEQGLAPVDGHAQLAIGSALHTLAEQLDKALTDSDQEDARTASSPRQLP